MSVNDSVNEFYTNDIVYRLDKRKRIVIGSVTDSYVVNSSDDSLQKGQVRVLWNNNYLPQVWRQSKLSLMNRSIMPGDVVRRVVDGKETQLGYCKDCKNITTVEIVGTGKIIEHVNGERLRNVQKFFVDDFVMLGNKFGYIKNFDQIITMTSNCGSVVEVNTMVNDVLDDYWSSKKKNFALIENYPGQEVICTPSNLTQPNWIIKTKTMRRLFNRRQRFTVQNVEYCAFEVVWSNKTSNDRVAELTKDEIKELRVIKHSNDLYVDLSERKLLKLSQNDVLINKKEWIRKLSTTYRPDVYKVRHIVKSKSKVPLIRSTSFSYINQDGGDVEDEWWTEEGEDDDEDNEDDSSTTANTSNTSITFYRKRHYPPKPWQLTSGNTLPVEVICIKTKLTVVWQDGSEEDGIPSTQLNYSITLDDHEFFPGECVIFCDKTLDGNYGVVQYANNLERTAMVKVFSYCKKEKKCQELYLKEFSVYDLQKHPKFVFRPGMLVESKIGEEVKFGGRVIDSCPEGYVLVCWSNNQMEKLFPHDIEAIPELDSYDFSETSSTGYEEDKTSWETESIESFAGDGKDETSLQNLAARLDFLRNRVIYLKSMFKKYPDVETFSYLKDLFTIYENSSYFDKFLGTSYFSLKSFHFQALLAHVKDKAKQLGVELHGRIFSSDQPCQCKVKIKQAEKETLNKMLKLENKINSQIEKQEPKTPSSDFPTPSSDIESNICVELLSMIEVRMDLVYADIISRIGGPQAYTVLTESLKQIESCTSLTPGPSCPTTPEGFFSDKSSMKSPTSCPTTPEGLFPPNKSLAMSIKWTLNEQFAVLDEVYDSHHFFNSKFQPSDLLKFNKAIIKEIKLLRESLPPGVWVRAYLNRTDLLSVMIRGPAKTPYQDGLFLFDIQLSPDYPRSPPFVHYISYNSERLNPNLYVEGKVCVSLLGTWTGRGTEVWGPNSTLLQLFVSIQGLILVAEPYYNEAGFEKQTNTQQGCENSRIYNELVILKLIQSMVELLLNPPKVFEKEVIQHFAENGNKMCERLECYYKDTNPLKPEFPLLPVSKGLKISLALAIDKFKDVLKKVLEEQK